MYSRNLYQLLLFAITNFAVHTKLSSLGSRVRLYTRYKANLLVRMFFIESNELSTFKINLKLSFRPSSLRLHIRRLKHISIINFFKLRILTPNLSNTRLQMKLIDIKTPFTQTYNKYNLVMFKINPIYTPVTHYSLPSYVV